MSERRLFVAGSTGKTGQVLLPLAKERGLDVLAHRRPKHGATTDPQVLVCELWDKPTLAKALVGRTTVISLIGTTRKRFAAGDTYESSDIGTTRLLLEAAKEAGTVDHFILLSSTGADKPMGAYLHAKAQAESMVQKSGLPYTLVRPGPFVGGGQRRIPGWDLLAGLIRPSWKSIRIEDLAAALLRIAIDRGPLDTAVEGKELAALASR